jgi:hypothetical protein
MGSRRCGSFGRNEPELTVKKPFQKLGIPAILVHESKERCEAKYICPRLGFRLQTALTSLIVFEHGNLGETQSLFFKIEHPLLRSAYGYAE